MPNVAWFQTGVLSVPNCHGLAACARRTGIRLWAKKKLGEVRRFLFLCLPLTAQLRRRFPLERSTPSPVHEAPPAEFGWLQFSGCRYRKVAGTFAILQGRYNQERGCEASISEVAIGGGWRRGIARGERRVEGLRGCDYQCDRVGDGVFGSEGDYSRLTEPETLQLAYQVLQDANHNYNKHRVKAMNEISEAAKAVGLELKGSGPGHEDQSVSDARFHLARRLLEQVRSRLAAGAPEAERAHVEAALKEIAKGLEIREVEDQ